MLVITFSLFGEFAWHMSLEIRQLSRRPVDKGLIAEVIATTSKLF
jgi:hypothetical protein